MDKLVSIGSSIEHSIQVKREPVKKNGCKFAETDLDYNCNFDLVRGVVTTIFSSLDHEITCNKLCRIVIDREWNGYQIYCHTYPW
jgi:hypothetical protein